MSAERCPRSCGMLSAIAAECCPPSAWNRVRDRAEYADYRDKSNPDKPRHKTMTLTADEFMRRFLLHVLPGGFHRIRHFGLIANNGRKDNIALARQLLNVVPTAVTGEVTFADTTTDEPTRPNFVCAHCGGQMVVVELFVRGQAIRAPPAARGAS